ncbi:hypothetical protein ASV31_15275 [Enterobacter hormaechei subsp. hoffmannii]|nr:hypothetical protein ASV31_15275 [Enterobacter hormaechei subsp. hoffmannii]KTJ80175.1 hypothetical protein ASU76_01285 [Enterobacter hormaechei subsp. hoffmannii]KTK03713.1 hypothetical protein ASU71_01285 [Enterobacter hormaechei subsp. hoffmannii]KTK17304.1 hypothetical protein ASU67_03080 [Enterobacter hormaechei subsp. hoffmannii]KVI89932.1 hypothetical protein AWS42_17265 [Enterobacter hormaechei subsp. hoffmannii]
MQSPSPFVTTLSLSSKTQILRQVTFIPQTRTFYVYIVLR